MPGRISYDAVTNHKPIDLNLTYSVLDIIYFLIACSIAIALVFLGAFFWAMRTGQNDDMQTPAMRILFEEDRPDPDQ